MPPSNEITAINRTWQKAGSSAQEKCGATVEIQTLIADRKRWWWPCQNNKTYNKIYKLVLKIKRQLYQQYWWILSEFVHKFIQQVYPQQRQAWDRYSKCWLFYPKFRFFATNPFLFWTDSRKQPLCITGHRARLSSTSHYCVKKRTVCFSLFSMKNINIKFKLTLIL